MEIVKDFGEITLPRGWEEITLKQFSEISKIDDDMSAEDKFVRIVEILSGKDREFMNSLPYDFIQSIWLHLSFLEKEPQYGEPKASIEIGKDVYRINVEEKLKFGEYVAFNMIAKNNPTGYAQMLGVLCRKDGEAYDSYYENEVLPKRIEMFENVPVLEVLPLCAFFLQLLGVYLTGTNIFSEAKEYISLIAQSIQDSMNNGEFSRLSTHSQKVILQDLMLLKECTLETFLNTLHSKRGRHMLKRWKRSLGNSNERLKEAIDELLKED